MENPLGYWTLPAGGYLTGQSSMLIYNATNRGRESGRWGDIENTRDGVPVVSARSHKGNMARNRKSGKWFYRSTAQLPPRMGKEKSYDDFTEDCLLLRRRRPKLESRNGSSTTNPYGSRKMPRDDFFATHAILPLTLCILRDGAASHVRYLRAVDCDECPRSIVRGEPDEVVERL